MAIDWSKVISILSAAVTDASGKNWTILYEMMEYLCHFILCLEDIIQISRPLDPEEGVESKRAN